MFNQTKIVSLFIFVILWQAIAITIESSVFPSIVDISSDLVKHIGDGELLHHLGITLSRVFITFVITMLIGILIGILMGISKRIDDIFDFILILGLNVPALVTIVICYIWFGLTDFAALLAVILNKVPIVVVNIREGTKSIEQKYLKLAQVYKVSKKRLSLKYFYHKFIHTLWLQLDYLYL